MASLQAINNGLDFDFIPWGGQMTTFVLETSFTSFNNDASIITSAGDFLYVLPGVSLISTGNLQFAGIKTGQFATVFLDGTAFGFWGLRMDAGGNAVIGAGGRAVGSNAGISFNGGGAEVANAGYIAGATGIDCSSDLTLQNSGSIIGQSLGVSAVSIDAVNSGTISGDAFGLFVGTGGGVLINSGTISAKGTGVSMGGASVINNSGTISGGVIGVTFGANGNILNNSGTISGGSVGVFGSNQNDIVVNSGTILGAINLRDGDDALDNINGIIRLNIDMGNGNGVVA